MGHARRPHDWPEGRGSIGRRFMDVTRRAWTCYWTHRAAHATVGILNALDDRALEDIGLSRSEIDSATHCCMFQETGIRGRGAASCGL